MLEADEDESDSDSDSDIEEEMEVLESLADDVVMSRSNQEGGLGRGRKRKGEGGGDGVDWSMDGDEGFTKQLLSYDIYIKGNVSKGTSFFKNVGGQAQRFRMFPYVEKKRRVDEYGETVDVGMWLRKGKILEEDAERDATKEDRHLKQLEEDNKVCIPVYVFQHRQVIYIMARKSIRNLRQSLFPPSSISNWRAVFSLWIWRA